MPPAAELIAAHVLELRAGVAERLVVGLCGAQGSGKSTVAGEAVALLASAGITGAVVSLDDFYLTKAQRLDLSRDVHPLLAVRGPPGTHDVAALGLALRRLRSGEPAVTPTFDKLPDDRALPAYDRLIQPADVIILEGWCIGAEPEPEAALAEPVNDLERSQDEGGHWRVFVNDALADDYRELFAELDGLVFLRAPDFDVVARWRLEQERGTRLLGGGGQAMSPDQIASFVQHYERITRRMLATPPHAVTMALQLDEARQVVEATAPPASRPESR